MSTEPRSPEERIVTYVYDSSGRLIELQETIADAVVTTMPAYRVVERPMPPVFAHDKSKRLFTLTGPDGKTEYFRDNPARQLLVEPDPETGEMKPVLRNGKPVFMYLCREEREAI